MLKNAISLCIIRFNRFINVNILFVIILSIKSQTKNIYRGTRIGEFLGPIYSAILLHKKSTFYTCRSKLSQSIPHRNHVQASCHLEIR